MSDSADLARLAARAAPATPALVNAADGVTLGYRELDERSDRLAHGLLGLGLVPGERVALWLETSPAHVLLYLAAAKARLVVVPVNERYLAAEAAHVLADSGARAVVFGSFAAGMAEELRLAGSVLAVAAGEPVRGSVPLASLERGMSTPGPPRLARRPEDPYILGYTSGTTGRPKGAVLTHRGVLGVTRTNAIAARLPLGSIGIYHAAMTFTATVPSFILAHFAVGGTVVLSPSRDPETVLDLVQRHRAGYTNLPPPLVDDYTAEFARRPAAAASLISVLQGAGKVAAHRLAPLNEALGGRLTLGWGMTENSGGMLTATTPADMRRALDGDHEVLDSVGRPVPGVELELRGAEGLVLPADGVAEGELVARSGSLMAGYWDIATGRHRPLTGNRHATGDIGVIDPDGLVHLRERRADLIVSGGMNVYPSEVEDVLRTLPGIADCAVVGVPDERWGQTVAAYVVRTGGAELTDEQVVAHCRARLASFKKPTRVRFGASLPRTLSGKVKRFEVREYFSGPEG